MIETVLVPLSGGIDSFYVAHQELSKGNIVHTSYVKLTNNHHKSIAELHFRDFWVGYLKSKFPFTFKDLGVISEINISQIKGLYFLVQPVMWILLSRADENYDRVILGTILGDDHISYQKEFNALHKAACSLSHCKEPILDWSYIKTSKSKIWQYVQNLIQNEKDFLTGESYIWSWFWTCETPVYSIKLDMSNWLKHPYIKDVFISVSGDKLMLHESGIGLIGSEDNSYNRTECGTCLKCHEDQYRRNKWYSKIETDINKMVVELSK